MKYEIIELEPSGQLIQQTDDNGVISFVPMDEGNIDYQNYLASLNETDKL
jgi:hypothetical protein